MTDLRAVQHPIHPEFQQQGPDSNCIIDGHYLGWDSCTAYAQAMAVDGISAHTRQPSGCSIRRGTGDVTGGLTLNQVAFVVGERYGIQMDVRVGNNVVSPAYVARRVREGRRALLQGDAIAFKGTKWQSTPGAVAHCIELNEVRGGTLDVPGEGLIYDPAADGDRHGWGTADQGPSWIPWKVIAKFMASLRPTPGGPMIGPNWCYVAFGPDTEPHVKLRAGARKAKPFPDRARAKVDGTKVHSAPTIGSSVLYRLDEGELVRGYQVAIGDLFRDSREWLGNDDGTQWVHVKRLDHYAGAT
jgi:hypothetical protein